MNGKKVPMTAPKQEGITINLEGLPQGVYLVSVRLADGKRHEKKLVVR